jgi:A/G-specific adenine glycosylase
VKRPSIAGSKIAGSKAKGAAKADAALPTWVPEPIIRHFAPSVIAWQKQRGRHGLPWQGTRDPYRVWMSEVMLQQTQVSTVLKYYDRFLQRFPSVAALAAATLDEVLAAWSGLGYYRRARFAHQCAQAVVALHGGQFPNTAEKLTSLPGIGRSTAAAVAAFCFGERAAILDGNVKRVLTRVLGFDGDLQRGAEQAKLWAAAEALLPAQGAGPHAKGVEPYTQGLMDLGAGVCLARRPLCAVCPAAALCVARRNGDPERYPVVTKKLVRGARTSVWLWLQQGEQVLLVQRPATGVWGGLWSLPEFESFDALAAATSGWQGEGETMPTVMHALTHFEWTLHPRRWLLPPQVDRSAHAKTVVPGDVATRWVTLPEALTMGLPTPWRRLLQAQTAPPLFA